MPLGNPLGYLKKGWSALNAPLVDPAQDQLDAPQLDRSPMEARVRGFAAGADEGLRSLTTPMNLAGLFPFGRAIKGGAQLAKGVSKLAGPTMDIIESPAVRQVMPAMDDVDALIGDLQRNLARIPKRQPAPPAGPSMPAEMVPVGGEAVYNAGRAASGSRAQDVYDMLMPRMGGRGR